MNVLRFKDNRITLIHGDMFEALPKLRNSIAHMIFADFPYGTTRNKWDTPIDLAQFWKEANRVALINAPTVCTAQIPFSITLGASNIDNLKYEWIWQKTIATGHLNAKKMPLKAHENVLTFYRELPTYNPQMTDQGVIRKANHGTRAADKSTNYNPMANREQFTTYDGRYPTSILTLSSTRKLHPTQKPVELLEYIIKTYTNEDDLVIDPCAGSGTTAIACINTNRRCIAIELYPLLDRPIDEVHNPDHFTTMLQRVTDAL